MNERSAPPQWAIDIAVKTATGSPCQKSKRGVVVFQNLPNPPLDEFMASGFNSPPAPMCCTGTIACRRDCGKICLHAEDRAIRDAMARQITDLEHYELVHAKVVYGQLVPGGGPSCWQCSRLVLEVRLGGVWLYQAQKWHVELRCRACSRITIVAQDAGTTGICKQCDYPGGLLEMPGKTVYDVTSGVWMFYTAEDFHLATLGNTGLHAGV